MVKHHLEFQGSLENLKKIQDMLTKKCPLTKREEKLCLCNLHNSNSANFVFPSQIMEKIEELNCYYGIENKNLIYTFNTNKKELIVVARVLSGMLYEKNIKIEVVYHFVCQTERATGGKIRFYKGVTLAEYFY